MFQRSNAIGIGIVVFGAGLGWLAATVDWNPHLRAADENRVAETRTIDSPASPPAPDGERSCCSKHASKAELLLRPGRSVEETPQSIREEQKTALEAKGAN